MSKPVDWAEKKALEAWYGKGAHNEKWCRESQIIVQVAKLLRAERAACVRVCKKLEASCVERDRLDDSPEGQCEWHIRADACRQCAAAIKGGSRG